MKRLPHILLAALLCATLANCSGTPSGVIGKEKMAQIIADLNVADALTETDTRTYATESSRMALKQAIYDKHRVTPEEMDSSLRYYGYNMAKYLEIHERAIAIVERRIADATSRAATTRQEQAPTSIYATEGDSIDLWRGPRLRHFAQNIPSNIIVFSLPTDRNWQSGDLYTLTLRANTASTVPLSLALTAEYSDGSSDYTTAIYTASGRHTLNLPLDPTRSAHTVHGYILAQPAPGTNLIADSITLVRRRAAAATPAMRSTVTHQTPIPLY